MTRRPGGMPPFPIRAVALRAGISVIAMIAMIGMFAGMSATRPALSSATDSITRFDELAGRLGQLGVEPELSENQDAAGRPALLAARLPGAEGRPGVILGPFWSPELARAGVEAMGILKAGTSTAARGDVVLLVVDPARWKVFSAEAAIALAELRHPGWIESIRFALTEGGRTAFRADGRALWVGIAEGEKKSFDVTVTARGEGGPSEYPKPDSAVLRLGRALARLSEYRPLPRLTAQTRALFNGLAAASPSVASKKEIEDLDAVVDIVREQVRTGGSALAPKYETRTVEGPHTREVSKDPRHSAILRDTFSVTGIAAGARWSEVPEEARAVLRCDILPDATAAEFVEELKLATGDAGLEWIVNEAAPLRTSDAVADDSTGAAEIRKAARAVASQLWPTAPALPTLAPTEVGIGAWKRRGIAAVGFAPPPGGGSAGAVLAKIVSSL